MSIRSQNQVSLKLIIDKRGKRILYAEADKKFIDFLFSILSLPVGTVIRIITTEGMVGSLGNLYRSADTMNIDYFQSIQNKNNLLNPSFPRTAQFQLQNLVQILDVPIFSSMTMTATFGVATSVGVAASRNEGVGYVKDMVTYMVMDDLSVKPMSSMSSLAMLKEFNMDDVTHIEEKLVCLDAKQGVKLLKASLHSSNVLTHVFLQNIDFPSIAGAE